MKTLSGVLLVLVAATPSLRADSAYFLKPATRPASAVTTTAAAKAGPVNTDRVSVSVLPIARTTTTSVNAAKMPVVRADRLFTRGAGHAAIVR